jgi:hypothetical protein
VPVVLRCELGGFDVVRETTEEGRIATLGAASAVFAGP